MEVKKKYEGSFWWSIFCIGAYGQIYEVKEWLFHLVKIKPKPVVQALSILDETLPSNHIKNFTKGN